MPILPLLFSSPAVLAALALLPVLWLILRITPPKPEDIPFPPLRLLVDLRSSKDESAHTPLWLLILRMAVVTAIIFAMAGPVWNPPPAGGPGHGPELIVIDDGWPAASDWQSRAAFLARETEAAFQSGRTVTLAPLSAAAMDLTPVDPAETSTRLRNLRPRPWLPDRNAALPALRRFIEAHPDLDVVWLTDGVEQGGAKAFARALSTLAGGRLRIVSDGANALGLAGVENAAGGLTVRLVRAGSQQLSSGALRALDRKGRELGRAAYAFKSSGVTEASFDLPVELRNQVARVDVVGMRSAGAVALLDFRFARRQVAVASGDSADLAQPYVAPDYFLNKALAPFADVRDAPAGAPDPISLLLGDHPGALFLADFGRLPDQTRQKVEAWVESGGILVRFAGTRLAQSTDDLIPVRLRDGGRVLGSALSWDEPKRLAAFDRSSPFFGLQAPDEVTVRRQVLAEPDADLTSKVWAALADGTPLVTAQRRGGGLVVLFHVTADTSWSSLPLSVLFVEMLHKITDMSAETARGPQMPLASSDLLAPSSVMDGYGDLSAPDPSARPIPKSFEGPASREHPPGYYGPADAAIALNALTSNDSLEASDLKDINARFSALGPAVALDLRPPLLLAAFVLLAIDAAVSLWLVRGLSSFIRRRAVVAGLLLASLVWALAGQSFARAADSSPVISNRDAAAALKTSLAYVLTGDPSIDAATKAGMTSLSEVLAARTSFSPGPPVEVDPARDELVFYPMIYWPVAANSPQPSLQSVQKIAAFMKEGGTVVFDTRDALESRPDSPPTPETLWLRKLLAGVDVPELEPVPPDHVITKTFYLLDSFVGRTTVGQTWIQALPPAGPNDDASRPVRAGDGVSPIILASNDLAAAWASGADGEALYPMTPGGARQHELALRGGVNIVMYTLTGNYKADQVHVRDLLNRLTR